MTLLGLFAHSFGRLYNLPVPFWMYAYGASAALALSFVVVAYFVTAPAPAPQVRERAITITPPRWLVPIARALSVVALLLCIATGLLGSPNPYINLSMTLFWIVFVLGCTYATALFGDFYAKINPWAAITHGGGVLSYPERLGYWPALGLYMAFIWIELFGAVRPSSLAMVLIAYSLLNLIGVWLIGKQSWFRYCEFFSVFFRLIGRIALVNRSDFHAERMSLVAFALFMLSSTAFDGLRDTTPWLMFLTGILPRSSYAAMHAMYFGLQTATLLISPFVYFGVYAGFIALAKIAAGSDRSVKELALRFAPTLLPIALVYHFTHYFTLLITQGVMTVPLLSDPFGRGWNLFGTARWLSTPIIPDAALVWHTQVALIVAGHIVSVWLAHREALAVFGSRATRSQLPMLVLMMLFTTVGLWILAQPIQSGM